MSYDWSIETQSKDVLCPHCGGVTGRDGGGLVHHWDPTYNYYDMFRAATETTHGISDFDGYAVADVLPLIEKMYERMSADPNKFRALDSPNGWGTYDEWMPFFKDTILPAFRATPPDAIVRVR